MEETPILPTRFPCWCRAIYSYGGESKKDLGFVEGDLIECLNAGDGSWWMGRLRRDKRAMGLFPSNFVQVLEDSFVPVSRASSPMPSLRGSDNTAPSISPQKTKAFRKPFQAYSAPAPTTPSKSGTDTFNAPLLGVNRHNSHQSATSHSRNGMRLEYGSRNVSPAPATPRHHISRTTSPIPYKSFGSSPPPPAPPPHRVAYNNPPRSTPSPTPSMNDRYPTFSRGPSPVPPSPGIHGLTPSPLRDAMDGVMSSLHDMALRRDAPSPTPEPRSAPVDPWSPEAFEELRTTSRTQTCMRPQSQLRINAPQTSSQGNDESDGSWQRTRYIERMGPSSQLSNHVPRMEDHLQNTHNGSDLYQHQINLQDEMGPSAPPPKHPPYQTRPSSSMCSQVPVPFVEHKLRNRKSAYELGREAIGRTFTTKSSTTNASSGTASTTTNSTTSTQVTSQSITSGYSAGGFSATSAGSLARRKGWGSIRRPMSMAGSRKDEFLALPSALSVSRPQTPLTGVSFHSSHNLRSAPALPPEWAASITDSGGPLGGLAQPKMKKSGFLRKLVDSARTGAASARGSIAGGQTESLRSPTKGLISNDVTSIAGGSAAHDMELGGGATNDWVQVRRDVNRSNSLSLNERMERSERCQMMDYPAIASIDVLLEAAEGDEGIDGMAISDPTNFQSANLQLVDKSARFVSSLPPMTNPTSLAQGYVCRPYRSDVQRLRAIFIWVSEKVAWEEDFEGEADSRRVIQARRGCAKEVAVLTMEMCVAMGIHAEVICGYLKRPDEVPELNSRPRSNHWWNSILVDGEWRMMDCSLASPTNPKRSLYSSIPSQAAESWWFLTRPLEFCYTHIPQFPEQQRICPPIASEILLALPCACPPYFKNELHMYNYDTSLLRIEDLELMQIQFTVPADVECFAEVEAHAYARDADGDLFESGDVITKGALAQAEWIGGMKRYTVKALLPSDEGQGVLKVFAGKRGLMHSIRDNPHPLAFALPILHHGINPPYEFLTRHPTPHAQRHDLYVAQPQCKTLAVNNTFVFAVRQHPSSVSCTSPSVGCASPLPYARPTSAMSMMSAASGSTTNYFASQPASQLVGAPQKPAKLAIQAPGGKILRLSRKSEYMSNTSGTSGNEAADGSVWETIIKIGERGTWRGLVLADRSARWCVFGEWECV
ncbi:cytokinesis protein 3 [Xylographa carneopallida]|nr:cytokinesis protein 3 [Xylographa carneopallida]